ncbi:MAG: hypothetical protein R3B93_21600 [Bacteroidia bacterium]
MKIKDSIEIEEPNTSEDEVVSGEEILTLMEDLGDYSESNETLKLLEEENSIVHIQISPIIAAGTSDDMIIEETKNSISHVTLLCFSFSNINEIKITTIPLEMKFGTPGNINTVKYSQLGKFKETAFLTREKVLKIVEKEVNINKFESLYDNSFGVKGVPNSSMEKLIYNVDFYNKISKE